MTTLSTHDKPFNAGFDHGAMVGVHARVIARTSVEHLKKGSSATTGYGKGFFLGFKTGWNAVK